MKASLAALWLLVILGFGSAVYLYDKVERLQIRLAQCERRDSEFRASVENVESNLKRLGGAHDELIVYLNEKAEADKKQAEAEAGLSLLGLLFGL